MAAIRQPMNTSKRSHLVQFWLGIIFTGEAQLRRPAAPMAKERQPLRRARNGFDPEVNGIATPAEQARASRDPPIISSAGMTHKTYDRETQVTSRGVSSVRRAGAQRITQRLYDQPIR